MAQDARVSAFDAPTDSIFTILCWRNKNSSRITVNAQPGTVFQERFAKKNEAEDLRRAFDKLDTKGYMLFNVMKTACMTPSFPQ